MATEYFFDRISELKEKFKGFFLHRKKITALENFSVDAKFQHKNWLTLMKACMEDGFLDERESDFIDYMLNKYEVNYLDWAHRTKWLKQQMEERKTRSPKPIQTFFNFEPTAPQVHVPLEVLAAVGNAQMTARV